MSNKNSLEELEVLDDNFEIDKENAHLTMQVLSVTRDPSEVRAETLAALAVIEDGRVPPHAIKTRQGPSGQQIQYASHYWTTRLLNSAFRWLWDFECLEYDVHKDGSVSSRNRMTIHIPVGVDTNGATMWHKRIITEIGSFEAYQMKIDVQKENPSGGPPIMVRVPKIDEATGEPVYTMSTADRVASSVSRGLVKCVGRAFGIGFELSDIEEEMDATSAWNILLRFGRNQGLQRDEVIDAIKEVGITKETLIDKFQVAYSSVYNKARKQVMEEMPDL